MVVDGTHDLAIIVFDDRQIFRHRPGAGRVAAGGNLLAERFVRTFEIVDGAPGIERALGIAKVLEALQREDLGFEGAIEAFVLAVGLGMIGPAVMQADAELEQPHAELGPAAIGSVAPGRAVVGQG